MNNRYNNKENAHNYPKNYKNYKNFKNNFMINSIKVKKTIKLKNR